VRYSYDEGTGEVKETLYPTTKEGKMSGFKERKHPKDFSGPWGETGRECDMFGQVKFATQTGLCMIVGGEHDALAAYQMMKSNQHNDKYDAVAVVSATIGESGAVKQIQKNYQFFNRFKTIIICMDNDKVGQEAASDIAKVLPRGKAKVMLMRYKDPNKYLEMGKTKEFVSDFWGSKVWTPAGVHASSSLYDAAQRYAEVKQLSLPPFLPKAREMFGGTGLVKGEITVIFAKTSVGKSSFVDAFTINWALFEPEEVVGVLSLEATVEKYSTNLFSNYLGIKLIRMQNAEERIAFLKQPEIKDKLDKLLKTDDGIDRFFVCDDRGADIEVVKEKILEMIIQSGVTTLIVDPFSDLMAGMDINAQEDFVAWLKKLLKEYPHVSLVLVCHTRKGDKNEVLREEDIIGTSTIMKSAAQTISLERDKLAENPILRNVTKVTIHKNRHYGETGSADEVYYDWKTAQLYNFQEWLKVNPEAMQNVPA
jgi:hypothetical protein